MCEIIVSTVMNEGADILLSLDDLLLPEDFERTFADFSNSEDVLFGPPSLILFEGQPSAENSYPDAVAPLQFPETTSSSGNVPKTALSELGAPPQRQRSGSSAKAAGKIERKAEQNRCASLVAGGGCIQVIADVSPLTAACQRASHPAC